MFSRFLASLRSTSDNTTTIILVLEVEHSYCVTHSEDCPGDVVRNIRDRIVNV